MYYFNRTISVSISTLLLVAGVAQSADNAAQSQPRELVFKDQTLKRDFATDSKNPLTIRLINSRLTGSIRGATLILDNTSQWNVTRDSTLDGAGFDYHALDRIHSNGHKVWYNSENAQSAEMREWTEELPDRGLLMPIMPSGVSSAIVSPNYVDGSKNKQAVMLGNNISITTADNPVNNSAIYTTRGGVAKVQGTANAPIAINHTSNTKVVYASGRDRTQDALMKYGVSAVVYANDKGEVDLDHFTLNGSTNGLYAVYDGVVRASHGKVYTSRLHGVQVCYGGTIYLDDVQIETAGSQGSALSSDHGGGWVYANNVTALARVKSSAGIYADGFSHMLIRNSTVTSLVSPAAVISGSGDIETSNSTLEGKGEAVIYVHPNGNNPFKRGIGIFSNTRIVGQGTAFLLSGMSVDVLLKDGTTVNIPQGQKLIVASSPAAGSLTLDRAREQLQNDSVFTTYGTTLSGDIAVTDTRTKLTLHFNDKTAYTGAITGAGVEMFMEGDSHWTLTGDSQLKNFTGDRSAINTNGHTLTIAADQPKPTQGPPAD